MEKSAEEVNQIDIEVSNKPDEFADEYVVEKYVVDDYVEEETKIIEPVYVPFPPGTCVIVDNEVLELLSNINNELPPEISLSEPEVQRMYFILSCLYSLLISGGFSIHDVKNMITSDFILVARERIASIDGATNEQFYEIADDLYHELADALPVDTDCPSIENLAFDIFGSTNDMRNGKWGRLINGIVYPISGENTNYGVSYYDLKHVVDKLMIWKRGRYIRVDDFIIEMERANPQIYVF